MKDGMKSTRSGKSFWLLAGVAVCLSVLLCCYWWMNRQARPAHIWALATGLRLEIAKLTGRSPICDSEAPCVGYSRNVEMIKGRIASYRAGVHRLSKDEKGYGLWRTGLGNLWSPPGTGEQFVAELVDEAMTNDYGFFAPGERPGFVVLDCGASIGDTATLALQRGAGLVVAIEPDPRSTTCLRRNFAKEIAEGRVIVYEKGVWNKESRLFLVDESDYPTTDRIAEKGEDGKMGVWAQLTTIDAIVDELHLQRVDFVKMDIEGAEQNALAGGLHTLARFHPRLGIATEHTADVVANTRAVMRTIRSAAPYNFVVTRAGMMPTAGGKSAYSPLVIVGDVR
jgi:FkbM family methyltransferase